MSSTEGRPVGNRVVPDGLWPIAILGATASGKSRLAMDVARQRGDVELVSVDSMQVYRGMDIGTAKPSDDERAEVRHHGLDLVEPSERFDLSSFQAAVADALAGIAARGRRAVLVGGTGLYLRSVVDALDIPGQFPETKSVLETDPDTVGLHRRLQELDPLAASRIEPTNRRRTIRALEVTIGSRRPFSSYGPGLEAHPLSPVTMLGIRHSRTETARRIEERFRQQLEAGFVDEVRRLRTEGAWSLTAAQALGYREIGQHLDALVTGNESSLDAAVDLAVTRTRQFATRQDRWFRRDPRITWFELADSGAPEESDRWAAAVDGVLRIAERLWGPSDP